MFVQNQKTAKRKQTTLSFAPKPKTASRAASAKRTSSTDRFAPYPKSSGSQSPYFSNTNPTNKSIPQVQYDSRHNRKDSPHSSTASISLASVHEHSRPHPAGNSASQIKPTSKMALSKKQMEAFDIAVNERKNIFITGSAGTGKSVLMREIIAALKSTTHDGSEIKVTASTGIAAFNIGGTTIHSFAGIGLGKGTQADMLKAVMKSGFAVRRWKSTKVLIIDEISMLDAHLFDALEFIARSVLRSKHFFGGIQLILTGDFYQLPPVDKSNAAQFAFDAEAWKRGVKNITVLTHVFRQKDMRFVDMLNEMRLGRLSSHTTQAFAALCRAPKYPEDGIRPTELYPLRNQVEDANRRQLNSLPSALCTFTAHESVYVNKEVTKPIDDPEIKKKLDAVSIVPAKLMIKKHAQVMLVKNMPESNLVNGSRGVVVGFEQLGAREYPIVRFINGVVLTVTPQLWDFEMGGKRYARTQVPLILAWALSIHKSQGQTIDRLLVDLSKIFEKGQAYVALSRAVGLDSLQVLNFAPGCVIAHPRVVEYYAKLARAMT